MLFRSDVFLSEEDGCFACEVGSFSKIRVTEFDSENGKILSLGSSFPCDSFMRPSRSRQSCDFLGRHFYSVPPPFNLKEDNKENRVCSPFVLHNSQPPEFSSVDGEFPNVQACNVASGHSSKDQGIQVDDETQAAFFCKAVNDPCIDGGSIESIGNNVDAAIDIVHLKGDANVVEVVSAPSKIDEVATEPAHIKGDTSSHGEVSILKKKLTLKEFLVGFKDVLV